MTRDEILKEVTERFGCFAAARVVAAIDIYNELHTPAEQFDLVISDDGEVNIKPKQ